MAKYVANGMYNGGHMHVELDTGDKPDIGAFRKLLDECKKTFGGGYAGDDGPADSSSEPPAIKETPPSEDDDDLDDDDDFDLDDKEPEKEAELPFSRKDVTEAAQDAISDSEEETKAARKKVAAIFKKIGGSTKLANIKEGKYGKIIRALKAGV